MEDIQKIVQVLRCCATEPNEFDDCNNSSGCPYKGIDCFKNLISDAAQVLEQEIPRVLAYEEVEKAEVVWIETRVMPTIEPALVMLENDLDNNYYPILITVYRDLRFKFHQENYGVIFRCWTKKPSQRQREEAPWSHY